MNIAKLLKVELIEEVVIDIRVDLGKGQEISTHFYRTIEKIKDSSSKKDP